MGQQEQGSLGPHSPTRSLASKAGSPGLGKTEGSGINSGHWSQNESAGMSSAQTSLRGEGVGGGRGGNPHTFRSPKEPWDFVSHPIAFAHPPPPSPSSGFLLFFLAFEIGWCVGIFLPSSEKLPTQIPANALTGNRECSSLYANRWLLFNYLGQICNTHFLPVLLFPQCHSLS